MKLTTTVALCLILICPNAASPQVGTAITYQGKLTDGAAPAAGAYDLELKLFDANTGGGQVGPTLTLENVNVVNGLFTVSLDFGNSAFTGSKRWLEIGVRPGVSTDAFTALAPRQELTPAPNALFSLTASAADTAVNFSGNLGGDVTGSQGATVVSNAVSAATADAIVRRDSSGGFSAGSIALGGNITFGNPSTATSGNIMKGSNRFIHNFGSNNTFIGENAGNLSMSGGNNTGAGASALLNNTTGFRNTALGSSALGNNTSGAANTATGTDALRLNTTGTNNTASGYEALYTNSIGGNNVATGVQALLLNTTASRNVAIGVEALRNQAFNNGGTIWNSANTAVGFQALRNNQPTSTSDGIGNTAVGANSLQNNTTGSSNTASGTSALAANTTGYLNSAAGASALLNNTTGFRNTAIGSSALGNNTSGAANTATGTDALRLNTTGTNNTASGYEALYTNSAGGSNVATGVQALLLNTTASKNVAIGTEALRDQAFNNGGAPWDSFNTAVGYRALSSNAPTGAGNGNNNTAVGASAMSANLTGGANTAVGVTALAGLTTGCCNVAMGYQALQVANTNSNVAIGLQAMRDSVGQESIAIGPQAAMRKVTGQRNIYIGENEADDPLNTESETIRIGSTNLYQRTFIGSIRGVTTGVADAVPVMIDSNGQLGTISSSRRYKEDIQDMGEASSALMDLRPVTYRYKKAYADGRKPMDYGLIAEEVEEVYPDLVVHLKDGETETVQYQKLNVMLLNEVQKQHREIGALKEKLRGLEGLASRLAALESAAPGSR